MADYVNTLKSSLFIKSGAILPIPDDGFIEQTDEMVINPSPTMEEFKRISSKLGTTDSYVDTCHATLDHTLNTYMRSNDKSGIALDTIPEIGELLKTCGFDESIAAGTGVTYTNSQAPKNSSAVANIDGWEYSMTDSLVGDLTITADIGKPLQASAKLSAFLDNEGVPTAVAAPTVALSDEGLVLMTCSDIVLVDGTAVAADQITIAMGAEVSEMYALGDKGFSLDDYVIKVTATFFVENPNYADAIAKLNAQSVDTLDLKFGTDSTGALIDGKSIHITAGLAKASTYSDSAENSKIKRSFTYLLQGDASGQNIKIGYGTFV